MTISAFSIYGNHISLSTSRLANHDMSVIFQFYITQRTHFKVVILIETGQTPFVFETTVLSNSVPLQYTYVVQRKNMTSNEMDRILNMHE